MLKRVASSVLFVVAVASLTAGGCPRESSELSTLTVDERRAQYAVELGDTTIIGSSAGEEPVRDAMDGAGEAVAPASASASATAVAAEEAGPEEEEHAEPHGPRPTDVVLTLLVRFAGDDPLPGITVDVVKTDKDDQPSPPVLQWIDTSEMSDGDVLQVELELEDMEYEDGDAFSVLLASTVPADARSNYREYAEAGR